MIIIMITYWSVRRLAAALSAEDCVLRLFFFSCWGFETMIGFVYCPLRLMKFDVVIVSLYV